jgi:hypothetical protein
MFNINKFLTLFLICISVITLSCASGRNKNQIIDNSELNEPNRIIKLVKKLPENASLEAIENLLKEIMREIGKVRRAEMQDVYEAMDLLRKQPNIVKALSNYYKANEAKDFNGRHLTLKVIGELRRKDAFPLLKEIIWEALPPRNVENEAVDTIEREKEVIIKMKAIHGIAFIRDDNGDYYEEGEKELKKIMKAHESKVVRIEAISAYQWNHGDKKKTASDLYQILPIEYHKYVQVPRFYKGMNRELFNIQILKWREKWAW